MITFRPEAIFITIVQVLDVSADRVVHVTPSRFTSVSQNRSWNTGNGSPDAICFTVDRPNISIFGVGVFGGGGNYNYELELIELVRSARDLPQTLSWNSLAVVKGTYGPDDCVNDIAEIKFDRPVPIKVPLDLFEITLILPSDHVFSYVSLRI